MDQTQTAERPIPKPGDKAVCATCGHIITLSRPWEQILGGRRITQSSWDANGDERPDRYTNVCPQPDGSFGGHIPADDDERLDLEGQTMALDSAVDALRAEPWYTR